MNITIIYRKWSITADDRTATGTKNDGSQERFECHKQPCFEQALRTARRKVDDLEGEEVWDQDYTDGALR